LAVSAGALAEPTAPAKRVMPKIKPTIVVVRLESLNARETASLLATALKAERRDESDEGIRVDVGPQGNAIVLTGPMRQVEAAKQVVRQMDRASAALNAASLDPTAQVDATVYLVSAAAARLATLSAAELTAAAGDTKQFEKQLAGIGPIKSMQRFVQRVNLIDGASLTGASSVPFLTGRQVLPSGQVNSQIEYRDIGAKIRITDGAPMTGGSGSAAITVESSSINLSSTDLGNGVLAPIFCKIESKYDGPISDGKPIVVVGTTPEADAKTPGLACVARIVFSAGAK